MLSLHARDAAIHKVRKYKQLLDIKGSKKWCYYNQCQCNEVDAVSRRHVREVTVDPQDTVYLQAKQVCTSLASRFKEVHGYSRWNFKQVIDNTSIYKKARYRNAYNNIKAGNYSWDTMGKAQAFVKFEKMPQQKADDQAPARLIQYRSFEYTYLLKSFLGPVWEGLKNSDMVINSYTGQRFSEVFTSGMNYAEMGSLINRLWQRHEDCVALCLDHSFFDGHHHKHNLELEHLFWNSIVGSKYLSRLLKLQRKNRVRLKRSGTIFRSEATRLSGDWNTSAGNSVINYLMLRTIFDRASIVVNGDDSIVFISMKDLLKLTSLANLTAWVKQQFARFGQITKVDRVACLIEHIEYCQCSPVYLAGDYRMVRNPHRCFGRVQYTSHLNINPKTYYTSVGLCELASNIGVPIMQQFSLNLLSRGSGRVSAGLLTEGLHYVSRSDLKLDVKPIDQKTRCSFYLAFGFTPWQQLQFERELGCAKVEFNKKAWDGMSAKIADANRLQRR